jgi:glycosyltransferase involved in cell wall biosynthesis
MAMKVSIIIPNITRSAGTERAVCNLADILAGSRKYEISIISANSAGGTAYYSLNDTVKVIHCAVSDKNKMLRRTREFTQIKKICDNEKFDFVIGTYPAINALLPFIASARKKIAVEHTIYNSISFFARIVRRLFYRFLDAVVLLTGTDAVNYGFHKNAVVIPNSLSFAPQRPSSAENKVILAVGRLAYEKGFDRLVDAISPIKEKCFGWQVRIIGDGRDKEVIRKRIKERGLEDIAVILPPTDKIEDEYCGAGIYAMSSRFEGLPMVLIEAKSCGLPVVSFDCPEGPANIVRDGIDGFLVENDNVELFSEAILKLVEDEGLRKRFGKEALNDIDRFRPQRVALLWDKLFVDLTNNRGFG